MSSRQIVLGRHICFVGVDHRAKVARSDDPYYTMDCSPSILVFAEAHTGGNSLVSMAFPHRTLACYRRQEAIGS